MLERKGRWNTAWAALCVMTLVWQLCSQAAGDLGIAHHCSVPQFPFQTTTTFWTSFGIELIWKTTSYWQKALTQFIIRFFPSSSKYPTATYKAKSDVFTAVKAAISQILSERRWNHTSNAQKRTCKKDRWENGCSIPVPTATPRDRQPDLPSLHSSSYHFQRPRRCCYPAISTWTPILIGFTDNLGLV